MSSFRAPTSSVKPETSRDGSQSSSKLDLVISFSLLSSPNPVPNPSHKSRSQIQVQNPKSKVQRKRNGTGADNIIQQATTPPTPNFSHLKCQSSDGKIPSMTFLDLLRPFITYHKTSMTFYDQMSIVKTWSNIRTTLIQAHLSKSSPKSKSQIRVPNPGPKSKSRIQNPKFRGKGLGLGLTLYSYRLPFFLT